MTKTHALWLAIPVMAMAACGRSEQTQTPAEAGPPATPVEAPTPSGAPPVQSAQVTLVATQGNTASGLLMLTPAADGVQLRGMVQGLSADKEFGFHVHEKGDCSAPDASSAGNHFNPSNESHGDPQGTMHHLGDMPNLKADVKGAAAVELTISGASLGTGQSGDLIGKGVIVHAMPDDYKTQPSGNSGSRIACGVVVASDGSASTTQPAATS